MVGLPAKLGRWLGRTEVRLDDKPRPEPEPVNTTERPMTGFFANLNHEQKQRALAYTGPDTFGDPSKTAC